jgi:leucyl/phenylalanyl-tRNA--protein transferase
LYSFDGLPELGPDYRVRFPDPGEADTEGIIGFGGNLSAGILLSAYEQGFFPWYSHPDPIIWWSPDPRFVLHLKDFHLSRRTVRQLSARTWNVTADGDFPAVIRSCAAIPRRGERGTWIDGEMISAYEALHALGAAHSLEVRDQDGILVGGLYGVVRGGMFCGESMFSRESGASKLALAVLVSFLRERVSAGLIDSQVANPHMAAFGGTEIPREEYLRQLHIATEMPQINGWEELYFTARAAMDKYRENIHT